MKGARLIDDVVRIERRGVLLLFITLLPLLAGLALWLNQPRADLVYLGNVAEGFVDIGGELETRDVLARADDLFTRASGGSVNLGVHSTADAFWLRVPLTGSQLSSHGPMVLSFEEPRFRRVDLTVVDRKGSVVSEQSFTREGARYRFPVFWLPAQDLEGGTAYARIVTGSSMRATVYLSPSGAFETANARAITGFALLL